MRKDIFLIHDTHELHRDVIVPNGDVLIHAGDFTFFSKRLSMLRDFNAWLGELPHQYKVLLSKNCARKVAKIDDPAVALAVCFRTNAGTEASSRMR